MTPIKPKEFLIYYAVFTLIGILFFVLRRRPRGMRLKLDGRRALDSAPDKPGARPTLDERVVERSLNVVFNYNGHSWDAYEVLGLPAGSGRDRVREALAANLAKVDLSSRGFIEAAYRAIESQWN